MTWAGIGEFTLGQCVPLALSAQAKLDASIGLVLPEIAARLAGALEVQASIAITPPSLAAQLEVALGLVAQLQAMIAFELPSVALDLSAMIALIAELQLSLGQLTFNLDFALSFGILLGTPGIYLARHTAAVGDVFPAGLPNGAGPTQEVQGIGVFATDAGAWTAMQAVFKVEP